MVTMMNEPMSANDVERVKVFVASCLKVFFRSANNTPHGMFAHDYGGSLDAYDRKTWGEFAKDAAFVEARVDSILSALNVLTGQSPHETRDERERDLQLCREALGFTDSGD